MFAHRPSLLLLDEPTAGLDPVIRMDLRSALVELGERAAVVLTTHLTDDVEHCCERAIVLDRGEVLFDDAPGALAGLGTSAAQAAKSAGSTLERGYERVLIHGRG